MAVTQQDLDDFRQFASDLIANGADDLSLEDLVEYWRYETTAEDIASVRQALKSLRAGEPGFDLATAMVRLRAELKQPQAT